MKHKILHHNTTRLAAGLLLADGLVFTTVDPQHASALWLIGGYILLGMSVFAIALAVAHAFRTYGHTAHTVMKRLLLYAAGVVVVLVGLQSVGQLTIRDVATLTPFAVVAYLYFGYGKRTPLELVTRTK